MMKTNNLIRDFYKFLKEEGFATYVKSDYVKCVFHVTDYKKAEMNRITDIEVFMNKDTDYIYISFRYKELNGIETEKNIVNNMGSIIKSNYAYCPDLLVFDIHSVYLFIGEIQNIKIMKDIYNATCSNILDGKISSVAQHVALQKLKRDDNENVRAHINSLKLVAMDEIWAASLVLITNKLENKKKMYENKIIQFPVNKQG